MDGSLDSFYILESVRNASGAIEDFRFVEVNTRGAALLSRSRDEIVGQKMCEMFPVNRTNGLLEKHIQVVATRKPVEEEFPVEAETEAKGARASWVHHQVVPLGDGIVITARDISSRKQNEERLREYTKLLEKSNRELEHFSYVASHDLQEPLRKIRAFGDRLQQKCGGDISHDARECVVRMQSAAERMQNLINDLLAYSRLATHTMPHQTLDLNEIARQATFHLRNDIEASGAQISIDDLPPLQGDAGQMRQLFTQLISNAIKFRRADIAPQIVVRGAQTEIALQDKSSTRKPLCRLEFSDNGIGFDEKYLDRIFAPFQRLHGRATYDGTGIGLALCSKIVESHGGTITAHSKPDTGSTFVISLPC